MPDSKQFLISFQPLTVERDMAQEASISRNPFPEDIQSRGLKPIATQVLETALQRGKISAREIAHFIPRGVERDRERLSETIGWLSQLFKSRQVQLVTDKEEPAHREQFPIVLKEKKVFRIVKRDGTSILGTKKEVISLDRLEHEGTSYERDALSLYYSEIRRYSLLSFEQELELGRRIFEDHDLGARNKLVEHNLRLVRWVARKYAWSKIDFADLVQEGNVGLITAAEKYDYRVGRFTTYAIWWVRQAIGRMIMDYSTIIRLPVHIQELRQKILKASREVAEKVGRVPTTEEIAVHAQISKERIERMFLTMRIQTVSLDDTQRIDGYGEGSEGDGPTIGDSIADDRIISPDLYIEASQELAASRRRVDEILREIMDGMSLTERNVEVFKTFYGFDGSDKRRTLEVVGQQFKLTRERIRQIIANIWQKVDDQGGDMDHDRLLEELIRIEELEKIVGPAMT